MRRARIGGSAAGGDRPLEAIGLFLLAMFVLSAMNGFAKALGTRLSAEQITLVRFLVVSAVLGVMLALDWRSRPLATRRPLLHVARGVMQMGAAVIFVIALQYLPLEKASAIGFMAPLYVTALSVPFLGETVGIRRWLAVVGGFAGVIIIIRPGTDLFEPAALLPLASSLCWAVALIITRLMRDTERPVTVMAWSTLVATAAIAPLGLADWRPTHAGDWPFLIAIGLCHLAGHFLAIRAFMIGSAAMLAPFNYSTLVWATLIGMTVFGTFPDGPTIIGSGLLVAAGIYVWHRERRRAARTTIAVPPVEPGADPNGSRRPRGSRRPGGSR